MCIIVYKPAGVAVPSTETLTNCWESNRDGGGVMWAHDGRLYVSKGHMELADMLAAIADIPPAAPAVYHFRIGTHGAKDAANTHPWVVIDGVLAMVHNGMLSNFGNRDYSDSRELAETIAAFGKHFPYHPSGVRILEALCGTTNKLVFMRNDGLVNIINQRAGQEFEGCWYSNGGYKRYVAPVQTTYFGGTYSDPTRGTAPSKGYVPKKYKRKYEIVDVVKGISYDAKTDTIKLQMSYGSITMLFDKFKEDDNLNYFVYSKQLLDLVPGSKEKLTIIDQLLESFEQRRKEHRATPSFT